MNYQLGGYKKYKRKSKRKKTKRRKTKERKPKEIIIKKPRKDKFIFHHLLTS